VCGHEASGDRPGGGDPPERGTPDRRNASVESGRFRAATVTLTRHVRASATAPRQGGGLTRWASR